MTVGELIQKLSEMPPHKEVFMCDYSDDSAEYYQFDSIHGVETVTTDEGDQIVSVFGNYFHVVEPRSKKNTR